MRNHWASKRAGSIPDDPKKLSIWKVGCIGPGGCLNPGKLNTCCPLTQPLIPLLDHSNATLCHCEMSNGFLTYSCALPSLPGMCRNASYRPESQSYSAKSNSPPWGHWSLVGQ